MRENHFEEDKEELTELLRQYDNLKNGQSHSFIEEDDFERIVDYYDELEDFSSAMDAVNTGLECFPYSSQLLLSKAGLLLSVHQYGEALETLEEVELLDNRDVDLYILKADAYMALDQHEEAIALLENSLDRFYGEDRVELLFEMADVHDDNENFNGAFDCVKWILEQEPGNEEALYKMCFWADITNKNEESIAIHQKITDELPYCELAWFNMGTAFQSLKLYEKAIDAYQYAVVINEKFDYAYRNMGDAYICLRKYKEAIEVLEKVLELARPESVIYEATGYCYFQLHNFAQARFYYRKASHLHPENSKLYYKIASTYICEKQWKSAIKPLESALRIRRNASVFHLAIGNCKTELGQYEEAVHHYGVVIHQRPKNVQGWQALIRCLYRAGYFEEAAEQCVLAFKTTQYKPLFYFYYSVVLFAMGKSKEAVLVLEKAMNIAPRLAKKMAELSPDILQNSKVVDVLICYKK